MRIFQCAWDGDVEGIRHVMDTGVQVDIQRQVSKIYHMPVRIVPEISSYYLCIASLPGLPLFKLF